MVPDLDDIPFEDYYHLVDLTDRLREVGLLVKRANEKVSPDSKAFLEKRDNPAKFVILIARVYKRTFKRKVNVRFARTKK